MRPPATRRSAVPAIASGKPVTLIFPDAGPSPARLSALKSLPPGESAATRFPALAFSSVASKEMFSPERGMTAVKVAPPPSGSASRPFSTRTSAAVELMSAESEPMFRPRAVSEPRSKRPLKMGASRSPVSLPSMRSAPPSEASSDWTFSSTRGKSPSESRTDWNSAASDEFTLTARSLPPENEKRPVAESSVRSEEHTSELQSRQYLVCRLLLENKKIILVGLLKAHPVVLDEVCLRCSSSLLLFSDAPELDCGFTLFGDELPDVAQKILQHHCQ